MKQLFDAVIAAVGSIILGKEHQIRMSLACLLAGGHLLLEDLPGTGKTTLAHSLAAALGLSFRRVQFTNDMLPGDILGVDIYLQTTGEFQFHPGPVFTNVLLADEINRTTPKTQSALLEAMEERQVSLDGITRPLDPPFFVIATQNPLEHFGTYPLPESQQDRFLMRLSLGYPDRGAEDSLLAQGGAWDRLQNLSPCELPRSVPELQDAVRRITVSAALRAYVLDLLDFTRKSGAFVCGLSPRAGLGIVHAAQAWACISGRDMVLPEDVQTVFPAIAAHRLHRAEDNAEAPAKAIDELLRTIRVP